ncbi:MAG: NAD(P)-binding domain-containing protein [Deltaproteobacteria bacterium]|nr:NAD(P)-binding domain-containing protein [Deltaproteobacteria bacterium]
MNDATETLRMTLVGAGPLARAIGRILARGPTEVHLWARGQAARDAIRAEVPELNVHHELEAALEGAHVVLLAVPADQLTEAAERYGEHALGDHVVLTAARGVGPNFTLPHEMIRKKTCVRQIGILGGPIHARELATGRSINAVLATRFPRVLEMVRRLVSGAPVALHASKDIVGVQVAGAVSNVASLAAGMCDALELGDTARGVLLTHGLVDARKIGMALGATEATFGGLAGLGELIPRHVTSMDRHLDVGAAVAKGASLQEALQQAQGHVEGVVTAMEAMALADARGIELGLVRAVAQVLQGEASPREALEAVLHHSLDLDDPRGR